MSWVFVVQGACLTLENPVDNAASPAYAALTGLAKEWGMIVKTSVNDDDLTSVFMGYELHPDRHICKDETLVMPTKPLTDDITDRLTHALNVLWQEVGGNGILETGIILNQFD